MPSLDSYLAIRKMHTLIGHRAEVSSAQFNYEGSLIATASLDKTVKVWDAESGKVLSTIRSLWLGISYVKLSILNSVLYCILIFSHTLPHLFRDHQDEVLDVSFNCTGQLLATTSADSTARIYSTASFECIATLAGHEGEVTRVSRSISIDWMIISICVPSPPPFSSSPFCSI